MTDHALIYLAILVLAAPMVFVLRQLHRVTKLIELLVTLLEPKRLVAIESDLSERKAEAKALRVDVDRHDRELREVRERVQRLSNPEVA